MQGNRSRDTAPEMAVRSLVHGRGLRYRVSARPLPDLRRTADLVFSSALVAVFVDGCYWHGCPDHYVPPSTNTEYWSAKIAGNVSRDRDTDRRLRGAGWLPLRFWEHDAAAEIAAEIEAVVHARTAGG